MTAQDKPCIQISLLIKTATLLIWSGLLLSSLSLPSVYRGQFRITFSLKLYSFFLLCYVVFLVLTSGVGRPFYGCLSPCTSIFSVLACNVLATGKLYNCSKFFLQEGITLLKWVCIDASSANQLQNHALLFDKRAQKTILFSGAYGGRIWGDIR